MGLNTNYTLFPGAHAPGYAFFSTRRVLVFQHGQQVAHPTIFLRDKQPNSLALSNSQGELTLKRAGEAHTAPLTYGANVRARAKMVPDHKRFFELSTENKGLKNF